MPPPYRIWSRLAIYLLALGLAVTPTTGTADDRSTNETAVEESPEQIATAALRRLATNIQFHKDKSVRLVRLSKAIVTDEHLVHLKQFPKLDYLAIICPEVTDGGLSNISELVELDTLLVSQTAITDHGLSYLTNLAKLRRLYLGQSNISSVVSVT